MLDIMIIFWGPTPRLSPSPPPLPLLSSPPPPYPPCIVQADAEMVPVGTKVTVTVTSQYNTVKHTVLLGALFADP